MLFAVPETKSSRAADMLAGRRRRGARTAAAPPPSASPPAPSARGLALAALALGTR